MFNLWRKLDRSLSWPSEGAGWAMVVVAGAVGVLAGLVAVAFDALVRLSENFFYGRLADHEFAGWKILLLIPLPAAGGLAVGLFNHFISRKPPGHGIPDVIEALARDPQSLRGRTGAYKMITASLTIGSGGSAGQEGPIVHIGSVVGAVVGRVFAISREHRNTLVACGAAGGLAAIFNAPIAGVIFVLEVILCDFSLKRFMPIVVAAVLAVATARLFHPDQPIFSVPAQLHEYPFVMKKIPPYLLLAVLCGLVGYVFSASFHHLERAWRGLKMHPVLKPALGGVVLGMLGVAFVLGFGAGTAEYEPPVFFANGYRVLEWLFKPTTYPAYGLTAPALQAMGLMLLFLIIALVCKILGTGMTLGSGGSGGTFAPSLFLGATLGGAFGLLVRLIPGYHDITPANFAIVGMAGVLAATVHCPLTAFLLVFEITSDYRMILPGMLVAVLATSIAKLFQRDSIYTLTLREHGVRVTTVSDITVLRGIEIASVPLAPAVTVTTSDPATRLLDLTQTQNTWDFVVTDAQGKYAGLVLGEDLRLALLAREALPVMIVSEIMRANLPTLYAHETLEDALDRFSKHDTSSLVVIERDGKVRGLLTRGKLMGQYVQALESAGD